MFNRFFELFGDVEPFVNRKEGLSNNTRASTLLTIKNQIS